MSSISLYLRQFILKKLEKQTGSYERREYNNLEKLYKIIQPGDVVLVEGRSEMSRIIKLLTNSHWSHVAMYVGKALINVNVKDKDIYFERYASDANHLLIEAFSSQGVITSPLSKYKDDNIRLCRPYGILEADLNLVIEQLIGRLGMRYDDQNIIDIALMVLQALWRTKSKQTIRACLGNCNDYQVICSGMIAQAFQSVGYPIIPALLPQTQKNTFNEKNPFGSGLIMRHYTQITPRDFDLSPNFEIIKFNIIGTSHFDYKSLWVENL